MALGFGPFRDSNGEAMMAALGEGVRKGASGPFLVSLLTQGIIFYFDFILF